MQYISKQLYPINKPTCQIVPTVLRSPGKGDGMDYTPQPVCLNLFLFLSLDKQDPSPTKYKELASYHGKQRKSNGKIY